MKILFCEQKMYYERLGILRYFKDYEVEFDGNDQFKSNLQKIRNGEFEFVVSILYNNYISNQLVIEAKKIGIKTVLFSDGVIEWANMFTNNEFLKRNMTLFHPIVHDTFFCVGEVEKNYFESLGYNVVKFVPKTISDGEQIEMNKTESVLITTANSAYFSDKEKNNLIELMREVIRTLEGLEINYNYRIFDESLINELEIPSELNLITGKFEDVLKLHDCVISTPSSIVLTAMQNKRAVAKMIYRDSPLFLQSGWMLTMSCDIEGALKSMIKRKDERIAYQDFQVRYYFESDEVDVSRIEKDNRSISEFIDTNMYNMLNSKFNINIEYKFRKLYLKLKKNKFMSRHLKRMKQKIK